MNMREYVLCVDLGGTKTYIAKGREDGEIEDIRRFTIDFSNQATVLRQLFEFIDVYLLENCSGHHAARCIGIGLKGYADRSQGVWKSCMTIPQFSPVNITRMAYEKYEIPTVIDNDVRAATLAELYYAAGKQYKDFIYYNVGTGIAIGIVSDFKTDQRQHVLCGRDRPFDYRTGWRSLSRRQRGVLRRNSFGSRNPGAGKAGPVRISQIRSKAHI